MRRGGGRRRVLGRHSGNPQCSRRHPAPRAKWRQQPVPSGGDYRCRWGSPGWGGPFGAGRAARGGARPRFTLRCAGFRPTVCGRCCNRGLRGTGPCRCRGFGPSRLCRHWIALRPGGGPRGRGDRRRTQGKQHKRRSGQSNRTVVGHGVGCESLRAGTAPDSKKLRVPDHCSPEDRCGSGDASNTGPRLSLPDECSILEESHALTRRNCG